MTIDNNSYFQQPNILISRRAADITKSCQFCQIEIPACCLSFTIDKRKGSSYNEHVKRRCRKAAPPRVTVLCTRNRHLAEWRFLLFTLIVIVH